MGKRNERGAGRKPIFTEEQIAEIRAKREQGIAVSALAKEYGVSRQTLSTYLNKKDQQMEAIIQSLQAWRELNRPFKDVNLLDYTMRMDFMCEDECCTQILVDFRHKKIEINNITDNMLHRAFGVNTKPKWEDFEDFLEERCFPRTRGHMRIILADLNLDFYDPLTIIEKTHGNMKDDLQWLKIFYINPEFLMG